MMSPTDRDTPSVVTLSESDGKPEDPISLMESGSDSGDQQVEDDEDEVDVH